MSRTLPTSVPSPLPVRAEKYAKADLRKAETDDFRQRVGAAIERARMLCGWSLKEFAGKVDRDPRQVARWEDGTERPHFDALFHVESLRQPLVIALAELVEHGIEIDTVIRVRLKDAKRELAR